MCRCQRGASRMERGLASASTGKREAGKERASLSPLPRPVPPVPLKPAQGELLLSQWLRECQVAGWDQVVEGHVKEWNKTDSES